MYALATASSHLYLFSTHITRTKIIAVVVFAVVVVAAVVVWFVRRRQSRA
jgi:hypothetical protein